MLALPARWARPTILASQSESHPIPPHHLSITVFAENGELIEGALAVPAMAKLAEQFHKEQLFLDFAAEVAREAKRLRKRLSEEQQLAMFWQE